MNKLYENELLHKQITDVYGKNFKLSDFDEKTQLLLSKINNAYHKLEYEVQQNSILFEEEENIVFTIGMSAGVLRANKKFYQTFGFKDLSDFKTKYTCVCELFIEEEGYLKETTEVAHWTKPIFENPNDRHKALIRDYRGRRSVYSVLVKEVCVSGNTFKICTFTDITELEEAILSSKKSEDAKTMFMANMSHEIRTPMNGIMGFTQLLLDSEINNEQEEFLTLIAESADGLNQIVDDILDFSKIENRKLELEIRDVNVFTDFYSDFTSFRSEFKDKDITYSINIDPSISEALMLDKGLVAQALNNLISNAIKFTRRDGEVSIEIQKLESTDTHELISFSVKDTGIGIASDRIDEIFHSFTQLDGSLNKEFKGAGLGLSISRSICKEMNSDLHVSSKLGKGSTFSFKLLLEKSKHLNKLAHKRNGRDVYLIENKQKSYKCTLNQLEHFQIPYKSIAVGDIETIDFSNDLVIAFDYLSVMSLILEKSQVLLIDESADAKVVVQEFDNVYHIDSLSICPSEIYRAIATLNEFIESKKREKRFDLNVLVAEDYRVNRIILDQILSKYGVHADFAFDGSEAVEMVSKGIYDLVLMDINMPNLNGVEASKIIKSKGINIPIIAVTANVLSGDRERFLEWGMDGYISKPLNADDVYNILYKYR